jgi:tetratricopeptide (TPR) repeat protein
VFRLRPIMLNSRLSRSRCAALLAACVLAILLPAAQAQQAAMSTADQAAFQQALHAVDDGKAQEAEPVLRVLARRYPANDQVNEALGLIYAEAGAEDGQMTRALPYLEQACKDAPQSALDHANLGTAWLKLGHNRQAAAELATAARLDPQNAETLSALGQAYMLLQDPGDAAHAFSRAAALGAGDPGLLYNWALALSQDHRAAEAAKVLEKIPVDQMSDEAESLAGEVEESLGDYLSAVKHDQKAAELNPSEDNLYALCVEFLRHWTWDGATKTATYAVERYPTSARLKLVLGVALYGSKRFADAAKVFDELLKKDPDNDVDADMLGRTCGQIADENANCDTLLTFSNQHPGNASAAFYAARQILGRPHSTADLDQAEVLLKRATAKDPKLAEGWYQFGILEAERKQWQQCAKVLEKATTLDPGLASAHYQLANAYGHLGRDADRKKELTLFQKYSAREKEHVDSEVRAMTVFLTKSR